MKRFIKLGIISSLAFILTGCVKMDVKLTINDENDAKLVQEVLIQKEYLESMGQKANEDTILDQFSEGEYADWDVKYIQKTVDGDEYIGGTLTAPDDITDEILDQLTVKDGEYTLSIDPQTLLGDTFGSDTDSYFNSSEYGNTDPSFYYKQLKKSGVEMTLTIKMPGKVTKTSFGKIDGDEVVIDLLELSQDKDAIENIKIVSGEESSSNNMLLYIAGGIALVAGIAVVLILLARKNKKTETFEPENIVQTYQPKLEEKDELVEKNTIEPIIQEEKDPETGSQDIEDLPTDSNNNETNE